MKKHYNLLLLICNLDNKWEDWDCPSPMTVFSFFSVYIWDKFIWSSFCSRCFSFTFYVNIGLVLLKQFILVITFLLAWIWIFLLECLCFVVNIWSHKLGKSPGVGTYNFLIERIVFSSEFLVNSGLTTLKFRQIKFEEKLLGPQYIFWAIIIKIDINQKLNIQKHWFHLKIGMIVKKNQK